MGNGDPAQRAPKHSALVLLWAVAATAVAAWVLIFSGAQAHPNDPGERPPSPKRNLIFMVSDGMGPASLSLARSFKQYSQGLDPLSTLTLDDHFIGNSRTRSSNSLVTDSAAGATAFACGIKTYNGAIAVDPYVNPCATVLEAAKLVGYTTGMVVTTRITDATPASFASHAHDRSEEDSIAEQLLGIGHPFGGVVDLMIGGGRCHFLPKEAGGCRSDDLNLIENATSSGWSYVGDRAAFDQLDGGYNVSLPLLGLVAPGDIAFDIDRNPKHHPSLSESVSTALRALTAATLHSEKGFFLLVEGSRIDHAGHQNDPGAQVREVLAYDTTFQTVLDFAEHSSTDTIVLSTSDHETGGLAAARQISKSYPDYAWYPQALASASHSTEYLAAKLRAKSKSLPLDGQETSPELRAFVEQDILGPGGLNLAEITPHVVNKVIKHKHHSQDILAKLLSIQAQVGWSTHGHSAVDVNVYGYAPRPRLLDSLRGGNENIDFAGYMADYLGVSLADANEHLHDYFR